MENRTIKFIPEPIHCFQLKRASSYCWWMKMMIWENSRIGIYTVGWGWILLISFFGVVKLEMGCKKNITSVSNGSGLGLGLELNYCNGSYHSKNWNCCVWAGFHQNTRPGHALHFQSKLVMESWLYRNKIYMWMMKSWQLFHLPVCDFESEEYWLCSCWVPKDSGVILGVNS